MIPRLTVIDDTNNIVLADDVLPRWVHARLQNDLRTWRSLAVHLFEIAGWLSQDGIQGIASDHDTLAMVALQRSYGLQPPRLVDTFA